MVTKSATANGQRLAASIGFDDYDSAGYTGVVADFTNFLADLTFSLHDPTVGGVTGNVAGLGSFSLVNIAVVQAGAGDDQVSITAGTTTSFTVLASEGSDSYVLRGLGALSYAAYGNGLIFDLDNAGASVSGKANGATDILANGAPDLVGTGHDDIFLVDATNVVAFLDGGAGTDLLSFERISGGATVSFDAQAGTGISGTFSNFERFLGSSSDDFFSAYEATGFVLLASAGDDSYALNGLGSLSYAGGTSPLLIDLINGSVTGKADDSRDVISGLAPSLIGGDGSDTFIAPTAGTLSIDGSGGVDVLVLAGNRADWLVFANNNGSGTVIKGTETLNLTGIEVLDFDNASTAFGFRVEDDFSGVGRASTFWQDLNGDVWTWADNRVAGDRSAANYDNSIGVVGPQWKVVGIGDLGGDGKADVVWHNIITNEVYRWTMNGGTIASQGYVATLDAQVWHGLGSRDFDGDGFSDLLWQSTSGEVYEWSMHGSTIISQGSVGTQTSNFAVLGYGDVNADAKTDVIWYDQATGAVETWFMNGSDHTIKSITIAPSVVLKGVGDFNGDGVADLIGLSNGTAPVMILMRADGTTASVNFLSGLAVAPIWDIKQVNDYNGDGHADLLWESFAGDVFVWEMNGTTILAQGSIGTVDPTQHWQLYS